MIKPALNTRYEPETDTVRTVPENYCAAHRMNGVWESLKFEGALATIRPHIDDILRGMPNATGAEVSNALNGFAIVPVASRYVP